MKLNALCIGFVALLPAFAQIEPTAGNWKTWVISSGKDYRVPPPPDAATSAGEIAWLKGVTAEVETDPRIRPQIAFWDAGSPGYRWMEMVSRRFATGQPVTPWVHRVHTYVAMAMYDATVAAWEAKYTYNRPRPSVADPTVKTALAVPQSPSYPSEHAAAAAAAAEVLAYLLPNDAAAFRSMSEEAGRSRLYAGLQYPSDYTAGMDLGKRVAEAVIAKARADGSDAVWSGTVPTGRCMWTGANPGNVTATNWKPFLLTSPSEFRPPAPPACDSAELGADVAAVRNFPRSTSAFGTNSVAYYWQTPEGTMLWHYRYADQWMAEDHMEQNPPRAARVYALLAASMFDAFIASQDGKFAYWYLRPHQLDSAIVPIFPVPNFPSYPSNHSSFSATRAEVLAYLFPSRAEVARAIGKQAGDSRIWAGIHYEIDNQSGVTLGKKVAQKFVDWANNDGSK